ncbi:MAG: SMP-30/gluconolactonase/LRE family protein [bacterium]|nr:SMP-30/gluconolactonase/LRE family protein [bacterium]
MMKNLRYLSVAQRRFVFFVIFGGALLAFIGITALLINSALNTGERVQGIALDPAVIVREFAALPGEDAYPPAVAVAPDGTVYTGSYVTGAVWQIAPDGRSVTEIPGTRDAIGAFTGIALAPDGALIVIDQEDTDPRSSGGRIWRIANQQVTPFDLVTDSTGWISPNDAAFDTAGRLYITDSGRNEVWRYEASTLNGAIWWVPPAPAPDAPNQRRAITGIAYDATTDSVLITDPEQNRIYRVPADDPTAGAILYDHAGRETPPGFDGITVAPDGTVYAAALGQNGVARVEDGELRYIAGLFRGVSDLAYAPGDRLIVPNFDQTSIVLPLIAPQLPFALDEIALSTLEGT